MNWKLVDIKKETDHKFLNFYVLTYEVTDSKGTRNYQYFLSSRKDKDELRAKVKDYSSPDGVMIPLYFYKDDEVYVVLTRQFRPAMGTFVTSVPAGLVDKDDKNLFETCRREALEEVGAVIDDMEILSPSAPTSSGLSDETNAVVLARVVDFKDPILEDFEDIGHFVYPLRKVREIIDDKDTFMAVNVRLILLYLLKRFNIE